MQSQISKLKKPVNQKIHWPALGRIFLVIDAANLVKSVMAFGMKVNNKKLLRFFQSHNTLIEAQYYTADIEGKRFSDFHASLERYGYRVTTKPLKKIFDRANKKYIAKANFDVEIAVDVMERIHQFDTLILFSGDSDFNYLVVRLRHKGKRVLVFSTKYHIARELIASCTKYFDIIDFKDEFLSKKIARLLQRAV